jgi:hypothetical protein
MNSTVRTIDLPRSIDELINQADELANRFERYDPRQEDRHDRR